MTGVETGEVVQARRAAALCGDVDVAEGVGWCIRGQGSRANNVVVNVESVGRCQGSRRGAVEEERRQRSLRRHRRPAARLGAQQQCSK